MAGAARSARRQAACLGLLVAAWVGCATIQDPPGGPPDFAPPILLSVTPDSGAVLDGFDDDLEFQFDEVIDERSGSGLDKLILLSPVTEEVSVSWKRTRITGKPKRGWRPSVVYHVTLLRGIADLSNNRMDSTRTIIFSTGGPIPDTRVTGTVVNWEEGQAAIGALVEATLLPDSLTYRVEADSVGDFVLTAIPPGTYLLSATVDGNDNRLRDAREPFDSVTVQLDSTLDHVLWAFAQDTSGPHVREVSDLDSLTLRLTFTQMLGPEEAAQTEIQVFSMPDTIPVSVSAVWVQEVYDSVRTVEAAIADSIRAAEAAAADSARADSLGIEVDSLPTDSVEAEIAPPADPPVLGVADSLPPEVSRVDSLLTQRPELSPTVYVRLETNMIPGARYLVVAVATNVLGAVAESERLLILPEPEPVVPDST